MAVRQRAIHETEERSQTIERATIRFPEDVHECLRTLSYVSGESINDIVVKAVGNYLSTEGHQEAVDGFLGRAREQWRVALDKLADG